MLYIHELPDWPNFFFLLGTEDYANFREVYHLYDVVSKKLTDLDIGSQVILESYTSEIAASGELEGEHVDRDSVRRSLSRRLGFSREMHVDMRSDGLADLMVDSVINHLNFPGS